MPARPGVGSWIGKAGATAYTLLVAQDRGGGTLLLRGNVIRSNGGPGILASRLILRVDPEGNDIGGNEAA